MDIFSIRLKEERKAKGFSQLSFANELQISRSTYKSYEHIGEKHGREPSFDMVRKIAVILDITTDYLFGLEDLK